MKKPFAERVGSYMAVVAWLLLAAFLTWGFSRYMERIHNPNTEVRTVEAADGTREVSLRRGRGGHYRASGRINGSAVDFLLDTGATQVVLSTVVAQGLGLVPGAPRRVSTANGVVVAYEVMLDSVSLGEITLRRVPALIAPGLSDDEVLLGMTFLRNLDFTQRDNTLILRH